MANLSYGSVTSRIEDIRQQMYQSAKQNGIDSEETILLSQELDSLISWYQKMLKDQKEYL